MRKVFYALLALLGAFIIMGIVSAMIWPVINKVETGLTPEYPDILPMYYSTSPDRVLDEIEASFKGLDEWKYVDTDKENRSVRGTHTTRIFRFVDDIEVRVSANTEFVAKVDIRSSSRIGKGDFGQNARNIRLFFEELNRRLGAVRIEPGKSQKPDDNEEN